MSSGQISREGKFHGNFNDTLLTVACSEQRLEKEAMEAENENEG